MEFSAKREHFLHHSCIRFDPLFRGTVRTYTHKLKTQKQPSKHFLFSKTSWRRLEDVFSVTLFVFQDVFKTSSRRVCKTSCNYVFKTSWKTKKCYTEDVFTKTNVCWEGFSLKFQKISKAFGKFCKKNFVHYVLSAQTRYTSDLHLLK